MHFSTIPERWLLLRERHVERDTTRLVLPANGLLLFLSISLRSNRDIKRATRGKWRLYFRRSNENPGVLTRHAAEGIFLCKWYLIPLQAASYLPFSLSTFSSLITCSTNICGNLAIQQTPPSDRYRFSYNKQLHYGESSISHLNRWLLKGY